MKKHLDIECRLIEYALCYLNSNWDEFTEDDLGITQEKLIQIIHKFQQLNKETTGGK